MLTETVSALAVWCLEKTGYFGGAFLMALESMIFPIPSEAVMPFVGFLVADGKQDLWFAVMATSLGSIIGSLLSYFMGYYGGRPFVMTFGRYLLLNVHDLEMTERFFHKRGGALTILIGRFIPVVRHFISIPAGSGRMPLIPFLTATLVGATIWNSFLLYLGIKLRENWPVILKYSHQIDMGIVLLILIAAMLWYRYRYKRLYARKDSTHSK